MKAVVALGANLGDPKEQIDVAVTLLREATEVVAVSSYYVTKPVGNLDQPDFINVAISFDTNLLKEDLLLELQNIERYFKKDKKL